MSYLSAEKAEAELAQSIKKACSIEETAPKQKHVRSKFFPGFVCEDVSFKRLDRMYRVHVGPQNISHHLEHFESATSTL